MLNYNHYDVIIIGGGPAGMAVAFGAARGGLNKILLLERHPRLGGILNQCIHLGFGLKYFKEELTGTEYAYRYKKMFDQTGTEVKTRSFVHRVTRQKEVIFVCPEGERTLSADHIVLATGCRERTRDMLTIPGTRPAGIFTAGLVQEMVNIHGILPGKNVVIIGSGDIGLIMARRMTLEGAKVHAVLEILDHLSGLVRNKIQCLDDFDIPLYLQHETLEIIGKDRVEAIRYRDNVTGKEQGIACDTLLFSVGLIPERDLLIDAGIEPGDGIHVAGNADYVHDLADWVTKDGEKLGRSLRNGAAS
ncbi:MAG: FAD-dependent oxidoreductase [Deltaproteobacteria bacterium]|nr:FAD-dependent oxidoreductase [Deltaproteobacteria bacterium]